MIGAMASETKQAVIAAIAGNLLIAAAPRTFIDTTSICE